MEPLVKDLISDDENAMAMIADLKKQLEKLKRNHETLEEECDLLAMENDRLRTLCQKNGINPDYQAEVQVHDHERMAGSGSTTPGANMEEDEEFLVNAGGDEGFARCAGRVIKDACAEGNVLCVEFFSLSSSDKEEVVETEERNLEEFVFCGGVDKTLRLYGLTSGTLLFQHAVAAPILAIDSWGALVACAMMDGSHAVIDLQVQSCSELVMDSLMPRVVQSQRDHTKYAVSVKWSPCGNFLATASHDKTVILYTREGEGSDMRMKIKHTLNLKEIPEDVVFCSLPADFTSAGASVETDDLDGPFGDCDIACSGPSAVTGLQQQQQLQQLHIIVPTRGASYLLYINCLTLKHRKVSLNEQGWDTHVSFNVLHMSLSPSGKQLLVATDKDFHIILKTGTNERLSLLAGHMCNDYGKPKTAWDVTGKYVYSNNQADHSVVVYAVNTGKIVTTLTGHRGQIRDIKSHRRDRTVLTGSYDHMVKEWVSDK